MNKRLLTINSIILATMLLAAGCAGPGPEAKSEPYEYTHTTELRQFEIYENERIKDADRSVVVTLEQLGCDALTLTGGEEAGTPSVEYQLPDDATQGPDTWYIIHLHFLIEFEEDTSGGFCSVTAKGAGASVQLETMRVNDSPLIRISGEQATSTSTRMEVRYYNYMTTRSVKPGKNEITFKLKEAQGTKVKNVTIFNDTGIESTTIPPSAYEEGLKLTQKEQAKAKELAFSDTRVQELAEGKEYALRITRANGLVRSSGEPPDDDIEVRLVFAETYMVDGVEASALDIFVDLNEREVTYLFPLGLSGMPELTESAREKAVEIALADARVQRELAGKPYMVGRVGIIMGGPVGRLGANVLFVFDTPYPLERKAPSAPDRQLTGVKAFVNLKEGRVVQVIEESAPVPPLGGER